MSRVVTGTVEAPPAAQITIAGSLDKGAIAALVEIALGAGAALIVQPRGLPPAIVAPPRALPPPAGSESPAPRRRAVKRAASVKSSDRYDAGGLNEAEVRAYLSKHGPVSPRALAAHFKLSAFTGRQRLKPLVARGVVELTGVTHDRRVGLPGQRAKEAP